MRFWEKTEQGCALKREKRAILQEIKKITETDPLIFGSVATGEATADSDIDIYIPEMLSNPEGLEEIRNRLESLLNYPVDLVSDLGTPISMRKNILKYAKSLTRL